MNSNVVVKNEDKITGYVVRTYDYDQFKHLEGNRALLESRKKTIRKSVKANGQLFSPILVNDKMEVIDGQGRLEVFRELGYPVEYIVSPGLTRKDCIVFNSTSTKWSTYDYVCSYAELNYGDYIRLKSLIDKHKKASLSSIQFAISGNTCNCGGGSSSKRASGFGKSIIDGTFKLTEHEYLEVDEKLSYGEQFILSFRQSGRVAFLVQAGIFCGYIASTDKRETILERWNKNTNLSSIAMPIASIQDAVKYIEDTYNYRNRGEMAIFENQYRDYLRQRTKNGEPK